MNKNDFFYLGRIVKAYGKKGELNVVLDTDNPENYKDLKSVFLDLKGNLIPYFIENIQIKNNKAIIKLKDVLTPEIAEMFVNAEIFLPLDQLPKLTGNNFYYHDIIGYTIIDKNYGSIGKVEKVLDLPQQAILQIKYKNKEILVPITDEIIKIVDRNNKQIKIEAPEGLIEIYL
ncbi:MAG: 16S rRNA processing protein RimM [Bacteroidetes bacterium]|nr:16S rRNA processing protein RimM [Bacteroidota bacterium]MCK4406950.1 16S rRNA processing protein RimM [Bacteroidales bacterium]